MPNIIVYVPDGEKRVYPIEPREGEQQEWTIGRNEDCDLVLPLLSVSGRHAVLSKAPYGFVLRDAGSTNGLLLEGAREEMVVLSKGIEVQIGEAILYLDEGSEKKVENPQPPQWETDEQARPMEGKAPASSNVQAVYPQSLQYEEEAEEKVKPKRIFLKGYYASILIYSVIVFFLAFGAGIIFKHYEVTSDLLPYKWLGIESPREKEIEAYEKQKEANEQGTVGELQTPSEQE